jgi:Right handed beta helix region
MRGPFVPSFAQVTPWLSAAALSCLGSFPTDALAAVWHVEGQSTRAHDRQAGTADQPLKSLSEAARRIRPGDTVVVGDGVYRETVTLPRLSPSADGRPTVLRVRDGARAIVRGSDPVTGWVAQGNGTFSVPWDGDEPQQVYVAGQALQQRGGTVFLGYPDKADHPLSRVHQGEGGIWPGRLPPRLGHLQAGEFIYLPGPKSLVIRPAIERPGPPADVEVSTRPYVFLAQEVNHFHLIGLSFEHANTSLLARQGAVKVFGDHNLVSGVTIRMMDSGGLQLFGRGSRLLDSTIEDCGQYGLNARGRELVIEGNRFLRNNTRGFNKWWEAGGAKIIGDSGLHHSVFRNNVFAFNQGDGLWVDWMNTHILIEGNVAAFNTGFGIHYEASQHGHIRNNASYGNGQRGIYVFESTDTRVEGNVVLANDLEGIVVAAGDRSRRNAALEPRRNTVLGNTVGWNKDIELMLAPVGLEAASNNNSFAAEQAPGLIRGWRGPVNQPARGLGAWRQRSGFDGQSEEFMLPRPPALKSLLQQRRIATVDELRQLSDQALGKRP